MKAITDIFSWVANPLSRRMLAIISIVALIFPIACARVQFRCTLRGQIHAALWMYVAPAVSAFLLVRVHQALARRTLSLPLVFMTSWALAAVIICNSLVSPFFIDAFLMIALHHDYHHQLATWSALGKLAISYYAIYQSVVAASLPAAALICATFMLSCLIVPLKEAEFPWLGRIRSVIGGMIARLPCYTIVHDGLLGFRPFAARGGMVALLFLAMPQSPRSYILQQEFVRIDRNHDGIIDQHEFVKWIRDNHAKTAPSFSIIDTNHSATIDRREWNEFFGAVQT